MTCIAWAFSILLCCSGLASAQPNVDARTLRLGATGSVCTFSTGSGSPEGVKTAAVCSVYVQTDASGYVSGLWIKQSGSGNTGWYRMAGFGASGLMQVTGNGTTAVDTGTAFLLREHTASGSGFVEDGDVAGRVDLAGAISGGTSRAASIWGEITDVISGTVAGDLVLAVNPGDFSATYETSERARLTPNTFRLSRSANASNMALDFYRARASAAAVQSGDVLGAMRGYGFDGTGYIPAAQISALVNGTPGTNDMPGSLEFSTTADGASSLTRRVKIGSASDVTFYGTDGTTAYATFGSSRITLASTDVLFSTSANDSAYIGYGSLGSDVAVSSATGPELYTSKSRGTIASKSIVSSGDKVMNLVGYAYDGSALRVAARMEVVVDGTPGSSDMPGRIDFYTTPDGSATPGLALRLDNTKLLRAYGTVRSDVGFNVNGSAGESKTCTNAANFTTTGGIVTSCTSVDEMADITTTLQDELAILRAEVTRLQRLVLSMAGGRQ